VIELELFYRSHTRTVVRECFKGDEAMRDYVLDGTRCAKFCNYRFRGFNFQNTWFCRAFGV